MVEIRTFRSKKGIRVDIYRKHRYKNSEEKIQFKNKMVGSFTLAKGYDSTLSEKLDIQEQLQVQNWLAETKFSAQFGAEADDLQKDAIRLPKNLHLAFDKLYLEAKNIGINFIPHKIVLEALFTKAKEVQFQIDKENKFKSNLMESFGIHTGDISNDTD